MLRDRRRMRRRGFLAQLEVLEPRLLMAIDFQNFDGSGLPVNGDGDLHPQYYNGTQGGVFTSNLSTDAVSGKSLQLDVQNTGDRFLYAQFNPYNFNDSNGLFDHLPGGRNFARDFAVDAGQWQFNTYNRLQFWIKVPVDNQSYNTSGNATFNIGTYVKRVSNPDYNSDEAGGYHFYHFFNLPSGAQAGGQWIRVIMNMHPNHNRGGGGATEWGDQIHPTGEANYNYFDTLTRFYLQPYAAAGTAPSRWLVDEMEFVQAPYPENDQQVYGITGVYNPANNRVIVTWSRDKTEDTVKHEVRYLIGPESQNPHEVGWSNLTSAPSGLITPPGSGGYNGMVYDTTSISGIGNAPGVWLAIKPQNSNLFSTIYVKNFSYGGSSDTTAPTISGVGSSNVGSSGATISWTTNEGSDTQVEYGTTTSYGSSTTLNSGMVTSHTQTISGLNPGTTYHYRVKSRDAAGNLATSGDFTFTTATADTTAPTADIVNVSPDPRNSAVGNVSVVFSENVTGVTLSDFTLTRNGSAVSLSGATLSGSGASYTLNLSGMTGSAGNYVLTLLASGSGIVDAAGNALAANASDSWTTDTTAPSADIVNISPDPRNSAVGTASVTFSESVTGVSVSDFMLTRNGASVSLAGVSLSGSGNSYSLNLSGVTANAGDYVLTLVAANSGISDAAGNALAANVTDGWLTDLVGPVISSAAASGVATSTATIGWATDEPADTQVEYGISASYGSSTTLDAALVSSHSATLTNLTADTTYHFRVKSRDAAGNLTVSGDFTFRTATGDSTAPTADIVDVSPDPRNSAVGNVNISFSESITGLNLSDFTLTRNGSAVPLTGATLSGSGASYTLNLAAVTGSSGDYLLTLTAAGSGVIDGAGNALSGNASDSWTTDASAPTVNIVDISPDPRNSAVGNVSISFSESITGLDLSDFTLTRNGSAVPLTGATLGGSGASYTLNLAGVSGIDGAYVLTLVAAGSAIVDSAGNALAASASDGWTMDSAAPVISNVASSSITTSAATINWTTDEPADAQVEYGTSTSYGSTTTLNPSLLTSHSVSLAGMSTGVTYHFRVKSRDAAGNLSVSGDFMLTTSAGEPSVNDWGTIAFSSFNNLNVVGPETWYAFTATRSGKGTVEAYFNHDSGNIDLTVLDANMQPLGTSATTASAERVDFDTVGGAKYYVRVNGGNADVDIRVLNLVGVAGTAISVFGTSADDTFGFVDGTNHQVSVNGASYAFAPHEVEQLTFSGDGGNDQLLISLGSSDDTVALRPGKLDATNAAYRVQAASMEIMSIAAGSGFDKVWLYDSTGNDAFTATPSSALMTGTGMNNSASGFDEVRAYGTAGGTDVASLFDSSGNDFFDAGPVSGLLRGSGFYSYAERFDKVFAYASAGGFDVAKLYDSTGSDYLDAGPASALLRGSTFYNWADRFDQVFAYSTAGGSDTANLYGSVGNDHFTTTSNVGKLTGNGYSLSADRFEQTRVYGQGGSDTAQLREVRSVDKVYGRSNYAQLTVSSKNTTVYDYSVVEAYAKSGQRPSANVRYVDYIFRKYGTWK